MTFRLSVLDLKQYPDLKEVVRAAFPSYKKHKVMVSAFHGGVNVNSYWDGGSKDEYAIVELATLKRMPLPTRTHPYFEVKAVGMVEAAKQDSFISIDHVGNIELNVLPPGYVLVGAGTFCGKPATAHIWFNETDIPKQLTEGQS